MSEQLLKQAMALSQTGRRQEACELLVQVIAGDAHNETAWLLYADALPDKERHIKALEECLHHNPNCQAARMKLVALKANQALSDTAALAPSDAITRHTEARGQRPGEPGGEAQTNITERQRMKSRPFSKALPPFFRGLVMFLGAVALLSVGYLIGRGSSRPDEQIILSPSPATSSTPLPAPSPTSLPAPSSTPAPAPSPMLSPEQVYARAMLPALREFNEWRTGPMGNWDALLATAAPEDVWDNLMDSPEEFSEGSYSDMFDLYVAFIAGGFADYYAEIPSEFAQAGALPILNSIRAEGFGVLASLGGAAPPDAIRVAHAKVEACVEFEINRAVARVYVITRGVITDLGPDPCIVFPEALAQMEQFVQDHQ